MVYKLNEDMLDPLVCLISILKMMINIFTNKILNQVFWLTEEWASVAALRCQIFVSYFGHFLTLAHIFVSYFGYFLTLSPILVRGCLVRDTFTPF